MAKSDNTGKKLAIGAAIAGAVGFVAGILTAPKSGKETRKDIENKAGAIVESAEEQLQKAHDELDSLMKGAKEKTLSLGSKARSQYNESLLKAKDAKNKASALLKAVKVGRADDKAGQASAEKSFQILQKLTASKM
jgi:gas vesicle protein